MPSSVAIGVAIAVVIVVLIASAGPAAAVDATAQDVARLAERAVTDPAARDELAEVTSVGGIPVDFSAILDARDESDVLARLDTLATDIARDATPNHDHSNVTEEARDILSKPPYVARSASRPGLMDRIGNFIAGLFPRSGSSALLTLVLLIGGILALIPLFRWLAQRNANWTALDGIEEKPRERSHQLGEAADRAESDRDIELALRLRFRAGVTALAERGALDHPVSASTSTVRRLVQGGLDGFLVRFDEIVYGRKPPNEADLVEARRGWTHLVDEASKG